MRCSLSYPIVLIGALFSVLLCEAANLPSACYPNAASPSLEKFVDLLPIPLRINVSAGVPVTLGAYKISQKLHRDLPATTLYGYGSSRHTATYPGPTLEAIRGIKSRVRWENHITDETHILAVDKSFHWANPRSGGVPTVTHLHGAEVDSSSDGHPDSWFTWRGDYGSSYTTQNYTYVNTQPPTMLWYHDHAVGITRLNVFAGLSGIYFIRSADEEDLKLPRGAYEVPLVIQDKQFDSNGTLEFPTIGDVPSIHPSWCPEFFGDTILVNGKVWPFLNVEARLYRFRILNGANSRFFTLSLSRESLPMVQIGTDGGYLPKPISLSTITMGPAERVDVLIDFSGLSPGEEVILQNSAAAPFPVGFSIFDDNNNTKVIMKFLVVASSKNSAAAIPRSLPGRLEKIDHRHALVRNLTLIQINNASNSTIKTLLGNRTWTDPATEVARKGSVEVWRIINLSDKAHVIHVHLIRFRVMDQQSYDSTRYNAGKCSLDVRYRHKGSCYTGRKRKPGENQVGWKDTVVAWPGNVTRLLLRFTTMEGKAFPFDATAEPGYLWHCHMVDHEDNDMMRPLKLV